MLEVLPDEISLIAADFVGTFLYAILTSVALAFIGARTYGLESRRDALLGSDREAFNIGAWWWYARRARRGPARHELVLLNFGLDELGNRACESTSGAAAPPARWRPTDPTPVGARSPR